MERTGVQKLAHILKILVTITFVCNLIALIMVPGLVHISLQQGLAAWWDYDIDDTLHMLLIGGWSLWASTVLTRMFCPVSCSSAADVWRSSCGRADGC